MGGGRRAGSPAAWVAVMLALLAPAAPPALQAQGFLTQKEALSLAFPGAERVERRTAYLDDAQMGRARELAGEDVEIPSGIITYYVGWKNGAPTGAAYFDTQRVRTHPQVLMVVVDSAGAVEQVEVVRFAEPPEYAPPRGWIARFLGRVLNRDLSLKADVATLTGATLTARATTKAVRRVLALHRVISPLGEEAGR